MVNVNEKDVILPHQKYFKNFKTNFNSVEDLFISKLKKQKNKKFIFFPEENLEFTYNEFFNSYIKISNILIKKGLKKKIKFQ